MQSLILICGLALAQADCSIDTATAVLQGPEVATPMTCGLYSQAYIAETAMANYLDEQHYLKTVCGRVTPERKDRTLAYQAQ